jgi:GNAT superfamily N-acetyltransferase
MIIIRTLLPIEYDGYRDHLMRLDAADRRLRFGGPIGDDGIGRFVEKLKLRDTRILAAHDPAALRVIGAAHLATGHHGTAEAAFSVDHDARGQGLGRALLDRAILWARNRGVRTLHLHFLSDNSALRALARAAGMSIESQAGECEAELALPVASPLSLWREAAAETAGLLICGARAVRLSRPALAWPRPV